jgi:hypothetical protein
MTLQQHTLPHDELASQSDDLRSLLDDQTQQLEKILDIHCPKCGVDVRPSVALSDMPCTVLSPAPAMNTA